MTLILTKSKIFLILCLAIIGGIFCAWLFEAEWGRDEVTSPLKKVLVIVLLIISIIVISVFWSYRSAKIIGFTILFFILGFWRWEIAQPKITEEHIAYYNDQGEVSFVGVVSREPDVRDKNTKLTIKILEILNRRGGVSPPESCARFFPLGCGNRVPTDKVLIAVPRYPEYHYGDELQIICQLKTPKEYPDFSYQNYLSRFGIYSVCYPEEGDIKLLSHNNGNLILGLLLKLKGKAREVVNKILPSSQASLLAAITLGDKQRIPPKLRDDFSKIGISHIVAISGLHIMLLSSLVMFALLGLGLWRKHAFYFATLFLILYILFIGAPASAVRAGIMGFLILLAMHLGRLSYSVNSIVLAGTLILLVNPKLLPYDVGFQLSFAAALGIIFFYPLLSKWLSRMPDFWIVKKLIILTLSAQITTFPLVVYHFSKLSLIAPLSNVLVVPLLPLIMILGFISMIFGSIYWLLGWMFAWLVYLPLTFIVKLSHYFAQIPYAFLEIKMQWWMVMIYYMILVSGLIWYNKKIALKEVSYRTIKTTA